jgi:hypothetical protein
VSDRALAKSGDAQRLVHRMVRMPGQVDGRALDVLGLDAARVPSRHDADEVADAAA